MAQTSIEWTHMDGKEGATWNPTTGCTIVSPGCRSCYAMRMAARLEAMGQKKYAGTTKKVNGLPVWTGKVNTVDEALMIPLKRTKPTTYFVDSMSDLFHEGVPFDFIDKVFAVMALTPWHTYQVLTKRTEEMAEYTRTLYDGKRGLGDALNAMGIDGLHTRIAVAKAFGVEAFSGVSGKPPYEPFPNVWLGTSVEDQQRADERIPHLLRCPAAVRFLSCEPLISWIDLSRHFHETVQRGNLEVIDTTRPTNGIHWCIIGGESGPNARPFFVEWARTILMNCSLGHVAAFVKQLGSNPRKRIYDGWGNLTSTRGLKLRDSKGGDPDEWPADLRIREFPTTAVPEPAGR